MSKPVKGKHASSRELMFFNFHPESTYNFFFFFPFLSVVWSYTIISTLANIELESIDSSVKAHTLINSIGKFQFIIGTFVLSNMLSTTYNLSEALRNKQIDLSNPSEDTTLHKIHVSDVIDILSISSCLLFPSDRRNEANKHFKDIWKR